MVDETGFAGICRSGNTWFLYLPALWKFLLIVLMKRRQFGLSGAANCSGGPHLLLFTAAFLKSTAPRRIVRKTVAIAGSLRPSTDISKPSPAAREFQLESPFGGRRGRSTAFNMTPDQ